MKKAVLLASMLAIYLPAANAVEFNKDALKSMQKEGHKIVAAEAPTRLYRLASGSCLHSIDSTKVGTGLAVKPCNETSNNQKWRFDQQNRLVNQGGFCVGVTKVVVPGETVSRDKVVMEKCDAEKDQQWKQDDKKRMVNGIKKCLQIDAANVVIAECSMSPSQIWN